MCVMGPLVGGHNGRVLLYWHWLAYAECRFTGGIAFHVGGVDGASFAVDDGDVEDRVELFNDFVRACVSVLEAGRDPMLFPLLLGYHEVPGCQGFGGGSAAEEEAGADFVLGVGPARVSSAVHNLDFFGLRAGSLVPAESQHFCQSANVGVGFRVGFHEAVNPFLVWLSCFPSIEHEEGSVSGLRVHRGHVGVVDEC